MHVQQPLCILQIASFFFFFLKEPLAEFSLARIHNVVECLVSFVTQLLRFSSVLHDQTWFNCNASKIRVSCNKSAVHHFGRDKVKRHLMETATLIISHNGGGDRGFKSSNPNRGTIIAALNYDHRQTTDYRQHSRTL